ncbi:N-formylglutamate amidohydrolase [Falsirhodobacter algicola]|uniref:N-formylglutamate amidohydrolase n=1 Tax=Falsirhodobacter algicola TaxID=2692330 RepID=A0A8J8MUE1_9RHOB|nr:N-formylglutamate amidohydrolase [Falsirhodobacter algicola]QUS36393.1 N-formylglutamate amidohydrolase [Falsirhodobacter algicola]
MTGYPPFDLHLPDRPDTAMVFSSPHGGCEYPQDFLAASRLDGQMIRSSEDAFVHDLFRGVPAQGAPLIAARAPRAFVDLNRAADELDPALIEGLVRMPHNPRVASGLGVIPRVVANGRPIYSGKITRAEAELRLVTHWRPYHAALRGLMQEARARHGSAILIDCHSMPHDAIAGRGPAADVVLGDRFGAACAPAVMERVEAAFRAAGLRTSRNAPFAGAYITQSYGRPARGQHAIQVEIDRALYMDEARIERRADFDAFVGLIDGITAELCAIGREGQALAAE